MNANKKSFFLWRIEIINKQTKSWKENGEEQIYL